MEKNSKLWIIIVLIIPAINAITDDEPLTILPPGHLESRLQRIIEENDPIAHEDFNYGSIVDARLTTAVAGVLKEFKYFKNELSKADLTAAEHMCGFGTLLEAHEAELQQIEDALDQIHIFFYRFTSSRPGRWITIKPNGDVKEVNSICDWMESYQNYDNSRDMDVLNRFIFHKGITGDGLMNLIQKTLQTANPSKICGTGRSPKNYFYGLAMRTVTALYKLLIVRYSVDKFYRTYVSEKDDCRLTFVEDLNAIQDVESIVHLALRYFQPFITGVSSEIYACDSTKLIREENFIELEGSFQDIVLPSNYKYGAHQCDKITSLHSNSLGFYDGYCDDDQTCVSLSRPCLGEVYNCQSGIYYYTDRMSYCVLPSGPRRYLWIEYYQGPHIVSQDVDRCIAAGGFKESTSGGANSKTQVCHCTCNDNHVNSVSTHIVNLMPVEADYKNNKVVTGVKFTVKKQVLHLQIEQGILGKNFLVTEREWKPIDDISERIRASRLGTAGRSKLEADRDYVILTRDSRDKFDIEDFKVLPGEVVTGVQLILAGGHVKLRVIARAFNMETGELCQECLVKFYNTAAPNTKHQDVAGTHPLQEQSSYKHIKDQNTYITFHASSPWNDFGQSTMPYFDAIPVTTMPAGPLSGIGTFLKISSQDIGLISLQLHAFDYANYLQTMDHKF